MVPNNSCKAADHSLLVLMGCRGNFLNRFLGVKLVNQLFFSPLLCFLVLKSSFMTKPLHKCQGNNVWYTPAMWNNLPNKLTSETAAAISTEWRSGARPTSRWSTGHQTSSLKKMKWGREKKRWDFPNIRSKQIAFSLACRRTWAAIVVWWD